MFVCFTSSRQQYEVFLQEGITLEERVAVITGCYVASVSTWRFINMEFGYGKLRYNRLLF
jgi:hypothetical protein